jgi:hypothetical protein
VSLHQQLSRSEVGIVGAARVRPSRFHRAVDDRAVDALDLELAPECALASWAGSIPRLDPRLRKCRVVEDAQAEEPRDRAVDELGSVSGLGEPPPNLGDGSLAYLEEAQGRGKDQLRIVDLAMASAFLCERLPRPSSVPRISVSHESPWYETPGIRFRDPARGEFVPT